MQTDWINALIGGVLIGVAVSVMLLFNGRVTGISGIINGALSLDKKESPWRLSFILGLFVGGIILNSLNPALFLNTINSSLLTTVIAGLLVGFGTILGGGCTSGHGVCGISRISIRSILATTIFIAAGVIAVFIFKNLGAY